MIGPGFNPVYTSSSSGLNALWGQSFTVPATAATLDDFTIWMYDTWGTSPRSLNLDVKDWDGSAPAGPALYSGVLTTSGALGWSELAYDTGRLPVTPGAQYVAVWGPVPWDWGTSRGLYTSGWVADTYPGGGLGSDYYTGGWSYTPKDFSFTARFSIPEPGAFAIIAGLGLAAFGPVPPRSWLTDETGLSRASLAVPLGVEPAG